MPIDASIIAGLRPVQIQQQDPLEQYGKSLTLRNLMLQGDTAQRASDDDIAVRDAYRQAGGDSTRLRALLSGGGQYKAVQSLDKFNLENEAKRATIDHTKAQTGEITAGHIAGAFAALARGNGSDDSVKAAHDLMAPLVGDAQATAVTQKLLSMPPETRLAYAVSQAGQHKTGQEALKLFFPQAHMQDDGSRITPVSTSTMPGSSAPGSPIPGAAPIVKTMTPDAVASNAVAKERLDMERVKNDPFGILGINKKPSPEAVAGSGLSGDEYLKTLPPGVASQVKALAEGKLAITPRTLQSPQGSALLQMAMQYEPGTDQTTFSSRNATVVDAAKGKLATSNNALNTVAGHLAGLGDAADKLDNTSFPWVNKLKNALATARGQPQVNTFNLNLMGVADELERAYRGAGGSAGEIENWKKTLGDASSPDQFKGALAKGAEMLESKLHANQAQIDQGMRSTTHGIKSITPEAQAALDKLRGKTPATAPAGKSDIRSQADAILRGNGNR